MSNILLFIINLSSSLRKVVVGFLMIALVESANVFKEASTDELGVFC